MRDRGLKRAEPCEVLRASAFHFGLPGPSLVAREASDLRRMTQKGCTGEVQP